MLLCGIRCVLCERFCRAATNSLVCLILLVWLTAMPTRDPMRHYAEVVYWDAEQSSPVKPSALAREAASAEAHSNAEAGGLGPGSGNEAKDVARLAKLRKRLRQAISASNGMQLMQIAPATELGRLSWHERRQKMTIERWSRRCAASKSEYTDAVEAASRLDAVVKARASGDVMPRAAGSTGKAFWLYQCTFQPYVSKALATLAALMSAAIVWSEGTLRFNWTDVSPFAAVRLFRGGCGRLCESSGALACTESCVDDCICVPTRLCTEKARVQPQYSC